MIYDPVRDRLIVFGGSVAGILGVNETWSLSLSGTPAWTQLFPDGETPPGRLAHSAIYDPTSDRMVVFGGFGTDYLNDLWALTLASNPIWIELAPSGTRPGARGENSIIYDSKRERLVVHAGLQGGGVVSDTWALNLVNSDAWNSLATSGLVIARYRHSGVYDPNRDRMIIFGGTDVLEGVGHHRDDVRQLMLGEDLVWSEVVPSSGRPPAREKHVAIFDVGRDRMVIQGGGTTVGFNDVWAFDFTPTPVWIQLLPDGPLPSGRVSHAGVYDPVRDRLIIYGGRVGGLRFGDVWALNWAKAPTGVEGLFGLEAHGVDDRIEITWGVRSREPYAGFYVLRAEGDGGFERTTPTMLPMSTARSNVPRTAG